MSVYMLYHLLVNGHILGHPVHFLSIFHQNLKAKLCSSQTPHHSKIRGNYIWEATKKKEKNFTTVVNYGGSANFGV